MIDPDGEFAFLPFLIVAGLAGAYLGGAASNNSWNPIKWKWNKLSTYLGIFGGGLVGAFIPFGFTFSMAALVSWGLGVTTSILITSGAGIFMAGFGVLATSRKGKIDWKSPRTYSAMLNGFAFGSGALAGVNAWINLYSITTTTLQASALIGSSIACSVGMSYLACASANDSWNPKDWKLNLSTVYSGVGGAFGGFMMPLAMVSLSNLIGGLDISMSMKVLTGVGMGAFSLVTVYLMCVGSQDSWNPAKWDMKSPRVYESIVGGFLLSISLASIKKAFVEGKQMCERIWKLFRSDIAREFRAFVLKRLDDIDLDRLLKEVKALEDFLGEYKKEYAKCRAEEFRKLDDKTMKSLSLSAEQKEALAVKIEQNGGYLKKEDVSKIVPNSE